MKSDVSIIIVNYASKEDTFKCIQKIKEYTSKISYEIIVVDNASREDIGTELVKKYPDVIFLQMSYNAGFARANNRGIEISGGRYVLLLNPDAFITANSVDRCVQKMDAYPDIVASGCQLLNLDGSKQFSGGYFERGRRWIVEVPYWRRVAKPVFDLFIKEKQLDPDRVDWIIGAFLLVRKDPLKRVGLFDEDFFLYAEEIELCSRLKKFGRVVIFRDVQVYHVMGGSSSYAFGTDCVNLWDRRERQRILSVLVWLRKQYGVPWFLISLSCFIFAIPFYACGNILDVLRGRQTISRALYKTGNYILNCFVWLSYLRRIISNKPYFYKTL